MTTITAETVLRSRNAAAPHVVLSTLLLRYPRWIHAEGRTHRLLDIGEDMVVEAYTPALMDCDDLSRNAASSRAIPVEKMIQSILDEPCEPLWWGRNVAGMQAPEELTGEALESAQIVWRNAMEDAISNARMMAQHGAHKQIVNRILEPYMHITVLVSATEWSNFLELRDHEAAEPHIQMLAREIRRCLDDESTVQTLQPGEWHLPFVMPSDHQTIHDGFLKSWTEQTGEHEDVMPLSPMDAEWLKHTIPLSVARCASTSYKTVDGFDMTLDRAIPLHDKLVSSTPIHASPAEHVAQADTYEYGRGDKYNFRVWGHRPQHGNFVGFRQYRHMLGTL